MLEKMTFGYLLSAHCSRLSKVFFQNTFQNFSVQRSSMAGNDGFKSSSQIMEIPHIVTILRQTLRTFCASPSILNSELSKLKTLVDQLTADDLALDSCFSDHSFWEKSNKAPCSYIEVFQNDIANVSVFILRPGYRMPLHDHPQMYGLLKVIMGAAKIRSFSKYDGNGQHNATENIFNFQKPKNFFAKFEGEKVINHNSEACVLTPLKSNFHDIQALSGPVAFFDILSPPYDTYIPEYGSRKCSYYQVNRELSGNLVEMVEVPAPDSFYCDQAAYLGPTLN